MLEFLISAVGIILTIFFIIGTHEFSHFIFARLLGVHVLCFSIGFGKPLLRWRGKSGTEYIVALFPLGGYVKMLDESEGTVAPKDRHKAFNQQPYYKKFLIIAAGPFANVLCAFVLYWLVFVIGFTNVIPVIGTVAPHSIAFDSGLKPNQEIVSVDNQTTNTWTGILFRLIAHAGNQDTVLFGVKNLQTNQVETHALDLAHWQINGLTPDPLGGLGITPYAPPLPMVIGYMAPGSPATASRLQIGDKILAINQQKIKTWDAFIKTINDNPDKTISVTVLRKNTALAIPVALASKGVFEKTGYLGVGPNFKWPAEYMVKVKYGPFTALAHAWRQITDFTYYNFLLFGKLITGKISMQSLGGPITIFEGAGDAINFGFLSFISFLAFLSISIGIINILPIPGLDGGQIFLYTIEFIIRRPIPDKVLSVLYRFGFLLIIFIITIALVNDILRLY